LFDQLSWPLGLLYSSGVFRKSSEEGRKKMQIYAFLCATTMVYLLMSVHGPVHMPVATQRNHELAERIFFSKKNPK
jgi:hypothetical protein